MAITYNPVKRATTLRERQLDFADAEQVFNSERLATFEDERFAFGEPRFITAGWLDARIVLITWTPRGADRRVISMRHCHAKEERKLLRHFESLRGS